MPRLGLMEIVIEAVRDGELGRGPADLTLGKPVALVVGTLVPRTAVELAPAALPLPLRNAVLGIRGRQECFDGRESATLG